MAAAWSVEGLVLGSGDDDLAAVVAHEAMVA
jgi:hypothetical protein